MAHRFEYASLRLATLVIVSVAWPASAHAQEIWVPPTHQQDIGGLGVSSNTFWPVTAVGAVRLAWAVPSNLQTFESARLVLIPNSPGGASTLNLFVCAAAHGELAAAGCTGPHTVPFVGVANRLVEIEISAAVAPQVGLAGKNHLSVLAYTTPTTASDRILGLRFAYDPSAPAGVPTFGANTFTGTQTAPAFVGDGSGLTNVPVPSGAATLGANTFSGAQTAPAFIGNGTGLSDVNWNNLSNIPAGFTDGIDDVGFGATLAANTFSGTQTIDAGNLDLDDSTATTGNLTKNGVLFLHDSGPTFCRPDCGNTFLGRNAGRFNTATGNTAMGTDALSNQKVGGANAAFGLGALSAFTDGLWNTAIGSETLLRIDTGSGNTTVGHEALRNLLTGSLNTAVGLRAGLNASGSNNIFLGANVGGVSGESNTMYLGHGTDTHKTVIAGIRGRMTGVANAIPVLIDSQGRLGTVSSSARYKEDVRAMGGASSRLLQLRPVTFRYVQAYDDGSKPVQYGLIAEEVAAIFPELAVMNADGQPETVKYQDLSVMLLNELQAQVKRVEALERQMADLLHHLDVAAVTTSASVPSATTTEAEALPPHPPKGRFAIQQRR